MTSWRELLAERLHEQTLERLEVDDPGDASQRAYHRRVGDVALDGLHRDAGGVDARDLDGVGHAENPAHRRRRRAGVDDDGAVLGEALGDVDDVEQRLVENADHIRVLDVVVDLDGLPADAGERLDRRAHTLGPVLGHGLHVQVLGQRGLRDKLGRRNGPLPRSRVPADLGELLHGAPFRIVVALGRARKCQRGRQAVSTGYGRNLVTAASGIPRAVSGCDASVNGWKTTKRPGLRAPLAPRPSRPMQPRACVIEYTAKEPNPAASLPAPAGGVGRSHRAYISRRHSMARPKVTSSAYSSSPPTGSPLAMRVTFTPSGLIRRAR